MIEFPRTRIFITVQIGDSKEAEDIFPGEDQHFFGIHEIDTTINKCEFGIVRGDEKIKCCFSGIFLVDKCPCIKVTKRDVESID